jgi:hypothetical protein
VSPASPGSRKLPTSSTLEKSGRERVLILVKALPHVGQRHGETVCCAGVTLDGQWRRQYPIHFRRLQEQFARWSWIEYDWIAPTAEDRRSESRRVQEHTIQVVAEMPKRERPQFLAPVVTASTAEAAAKGMSLTLVRPLKSRFYWKAKTAGQIEKERVAYDAAARQQSFLDPVLVAMTPCPYAFHFDWTDADGKPHKSTCDDWETAATFYRLEKTLGPEGALAEMDTIFNERYPAKGMVYAMGTHSRYPNIWLLVGVLRLDPASQLSLAL